MKQGTVWKFETAKLVVSLEIERDRHYDYDGEDNFTAEYPQGETHMKLRSGEYVAFESRVVIRLKDESHVADASLYGSVYGADNYSDFWTAHRDPDAMNRNCEAMRAAKGGNVAICHYFPDMVRQAISQAREKLAGYPRLREVRQ